MTFLKWSVLPINFYKIVRNKMLQIYNSEMNPQGWEDKKVVHQKGLWHKVFTGMVYNKAEKSLYLQTIFPKESYSFDRPDYVDFTVGGHVEGDESILEGGIREIKEEIGRTVTNEQLTFLGIRVCNCNPTENYKIREFQYFFGIESTDEIKDFDFNVMDKEVKSIIKLKIDDFLRLLNKDAFAVEGTEFIFDRENKKININKKVSITQERIIPDYFTDKSVIEKVLSLKAVVENFK